MSNLNKIYKFFSIDHITRTDIIFIAVIIVLCIILAIIPTGFEDAYIGDGISVKCEIIEVDNSHVHTIGLIKTGEQGLTVKVLNGKFREQSFDTTNHFLGKLDLDKFYTIGDKVFTILDIEEGKILRLGVPTVQYRRRKNQICSGN